MKAQQALSLAVICGLVIWVALVIVSMLKPPGHVWEKLVLLAGPVLILSMLRMGWTKSPGFGWNATMLGWFPPFATCVVYAVALSLPLSALPYGLVWESGEVGDLAGNWFPLGEVMVGVVIANLSVGSAIWMILALLCAAGFFCAAFEKMTSHRGRGNPQETRVSGAR